MRNRKKDARISERSSNNTLRNVYAVGSALYLLEKCKRKRRRIIILLP